MFKLTKVNISKLIKNPLSVLQTLSDNDIAHIIQQANQAYYNKTPVISDQLYDIIKEYLEDKSPHHPILKNIGAIVDNDQRKSTLPYFMGSLDKIKGDEKHIDKFRQNYPGNYIVSDKLDGNSGLLVCRNDSISLYTRGDGTIGQNINHIIPFIQGIPKAKGDYAVRGEIIISKESFEKVKSKGANARNMVAGMLNAKTPDIEIARLSTFVAYELIMPILAPKDQLIYLTNLGFSVVYHEHIQEHSLTNVSLSKLLVDRRTHSPFEVDGLVVMHNQIHDRKPGNPSYGFAFKSVHTMAKAEVVVKNVEWNLSKDGYLVPTIMFRSVALAGVNIQRATGFNAKFIMDNKIGPGSKIVIMRSGDVVPNVHTVLSPSDTGVGQLPEQPFIWSETGVNIMLDEANKKASDELRFKNFENFVQKIDIIGLGPGNIRKLFDANIDTPQKLFKATQKDMMAVDGFQTKMATKVYDAVQMRKNNLSCLLLMDASNCMGRGLGSKKLELIINAFPNILVKRQTPSITELTQLKGVEKTTANLFLKNLPAFFNYIDDNGLSHVCNQANNKQDESKQSTANNTYETLFKDKRFVFTGFRNKELENLIKANGGEVSSGVSKKTNLLLAKNIDDDSGKAEKARELGIEIVQIDNFIKSNMLTV